MIEEILKYDPKFNEALFLSKADHIFMMILDSILEKNMLNVKHYLSDEVYNKYDMLVKSYESKGLTRIFDETNVKSTSIVDTYISDNKINIVVNLTSRYMDYMIDQDGNYVSGNNKSRIEKEHKIVFSKYLDTKELKEARRCNNCGNTLDINHSGICPYCGQVFDMSNYDYIITQID